MNCQECRTHLHPFLDSELEVKDNLAILEHVNACAACRGLFDSEERCWRRVRETLRRESAPSAFVAGLPVLLERDGRRLFFRRAGLGLGAAAAGVALFLAVLYHDRPVRPHDHGPAIDFAVSHFLGLDDEARETKRPILDPDLLRSKSVDFQELEGEALVAFYQQLFGPDARLPEEILAPRTAAAALTVGFKGTPVSNMILDLQDRKIGVYRLRREQAELMDMHLEEGGVTTGFRIDRCKGCHVIAVTRGDMVYILVSREGVGPLIQLVRQTF